MGSNMIDYFEHEYHLWFFLTDAAQAPIWSLEKWAAFADVADPVVRACRARAAVRSQQLDASRKIQLKFGPLGWDERSHAKWCHSGDDKRVLIHTDLWAPSWGRCAKNGVPPDFFLGIKNHAHGTQVDLKFGAVIVMALRCDVFDNGPSLARKISGLTNPLMWGYKRRPWAIRCGKSGAYTKSISYMAVLGVLKNGDWQRRGVDPSCLEEEWETLSLRAGGASGGLRDCLYSSGPRFQVDFT